VMSIQHGVLVSVVDVDKMGYQEIIVCDCSPTLRNPVIDLLRLIYELSEKRLIYQDVGVKAGLVCTA